MPPVLVLDSLLPVGDVKFAKESRIGFTAPAGPSQPPFQHVVFQGSVLNIIHTGDDINADAGSDADVINNLIHLVVGPWWGDLQKVVPHVTIGEYYSSNPDQDDYMRWSIQGLTFTKKAGAIGSPNAGEKRIQLEFTVGLQGTHSHVYRLNYYVTAVGRSLGVGGIESP